MWIVYFLKNSFDLHQCWSFHAFLLFELGSYLCVCMRGVCVCVCAWCTGLVTHGLRQRVSEGRESRPWVGLKTSDAWLKRPRKFQQAAVIAEIVYVCVWVGVCGCLCQCKSGPTGDSMRQHRMECLGKVCSDKSSNVACSISVCDTLLPSECSRMWSMTTRLQKIIFFLHKSKAVWTHFWNSFVKCLLLTLRNPV